jgi:iron complex transport system substrate-binding protein
MLGLVLAVFATVRPIILPQPYPARTVIDATGAKVQVPMSNRGTVLGAPFLGEYMIATNDVESLFSINEVNLRTANTGPLGRIYPQLLSKRTDLADGLNPERLLLAQPGAIIPWGPAPEGVKATGLPVIELNTMWVEGWWFENARIFGDLNGQPNRGRELKQRYCQAIGNLQAELPPEKITTQPTILEVSPGRDGTLRNTGVSGHQDQFQTLAGGLNAIQFNSMPKRLDMERLYILDPDVLILSRVSALSPAECMSHPLWRSLKAVQNRRVYRRPPGMVFTTTGIVEYPIYARWLAEVLHPDQLKPKLREIMRQSYRRELHYNMTDRDLDQLLAVADNRFSANHERFEAPDAH